MKTIITFGTFDLFHIGHLNILKRAKNLGDHLIVGISSDDLNFKKKNKYPVYNERERLEIVSAIKYVNAVFLETSLELKAEYINFYEADVLVMGNDWVGKFDWVKELTDADVIYLPRTENVSTTQVISSIKDL